jgi:histone deacetylase 11
METENTTPKKHIVYHPYYDITFFGLEKIHPFDSAKYSKIANSLIAKKLLSQDDFHTPQEVTDEDLERVHTKQYLSNLYHCASAMFAQASGIAGSAPTLGVVLSLVPNCIMRWKALYPMRLATGGTIEATQLALTNGWAINLSGGYHHAKKDDCYQGGFCIYNDAAVAAHIAIKEHKINKILVVDLDAHQGNGNESIFGEQETFKGKVDVFDIYGADNYPIYTEHRLIENQKTWYNHPVQTSQATDTFYQELLNHLSDAIEKTKPQLIIYNAGTDIYEKDPLGNMRVTKQGIINRDAHVFNLAQEKNIPIVMMLSGGYTSESAGIISDSIENIMSIMKEKK